MKNIVLFVVSLVFLVSCINNREKFTVISETVVDSVYVPYGDSLNRQLGFGQIVGENDDVLMYQGYRFGVFGNILYFYDINTKKLLNKIDCNAILENRSLARALYVNMDSIFLFASSYNTVDTSVVLINYNGDTKRIYKTKNPFFTTIENPFEKDSSLIVYNFFITKPVYFDKKIFFGSRILFSAEFGTEKFCNSKYPIVGYFDLVKDTVVLNHKLWFPNCIEGHYYPNKAKQVSLCKSHNNTLLISFSYTDLLYEWDVNNDLVFEHTFKSELIDTILPEKEINVFFSKTQPFNYSISYIDSLDLYVKFMFLPKEKYGKEWNIITYADENFNYKGESISSTYGANFLETDNIAGWTIQTTNKKKAFTEKDSIKLVKKNYVLGKLNIDSLKSVLQQAKQSVKKQKEEKFCSIMGSNYKFEVYTDKLMIDYTKKMFNIEDSTSFALFVVTDKDCHSCDDYVLQFINANNATINTTGACLLFAGDNTTYFNRLINENNLLNINNLRIDTTGIYTDLHHFSQYNPRLVLCRDNKIVKDTIFMPDDLEQMMMDYINFYNYEVE